jgi:hypothetical protein
MLFPPSVMATRTYSGVKDFSVYDGVRIVFEATYPKMEAHTVVFNATHSLIIARAACSGG